MFSFYHTTGFAHAPVSKGLLGGLALSSLAFNLPFYSYQYAFSYSQAQLWKPHNILRLMLSRTVFLAPQDMIWAGILIYQFRMFERRYGSNKYASFLLSMFLFSTGVELCLVHLCNMLHLAMYHMPTGPYGMVFSLFVPFFCDIPRVAIARVWGIPITGKYISYIIGLQMASDCRESFLLALCGIVSGILYRANLLCVMSWRIPCWLSELCHTTLGRLLDLASSLSSTHNDGEGVPLGATLAIQRLQYVERLEQQMMQAQQRGNQNLPAMFGALLGQQNNGNVWQQINNANVGPPGEEQISRLVEMGFSRAAVLQAMSTTNNDVTLATNILLQQS